MGAEKSIQNLPQDLELNSWLKLALTSRNETSRLIALEEMVTNGFPPEFASVLKEISEKDPSESCRLQAQWLLKLDATKSSLKSLIKKLDITPEFINLQIQKKDLAKVVLIKQILRKSPSEQTIELWRQALAVENERYFLEFGLELLSKFGEKKDSVFAVKHLHNPNPQVVCSALTLLAQKDQETFKKCIRLGLSNKNATIIMHSVHLLRTIDEPEALKYLSVLVLNQNPLVRQKALRELMLVKFEKVENLFWQYIGREDQTFLLVKAGLLATFNPAPHFPFKIYDIMSTASGVKQHILQLILKEVIKTTNMAGVLKNKDINTYLNEIKNYIANKKKEQTLRVVISNLKAKEVGIRADAVEKLSRFISHPQIRALLANQLKIETDEGIKSYLASLFEDATDEEIKVQKEEEQQNAAVPLMSEKATVLPSLDSQPQEKTEEKALETKDKILKSFPSQDEFIKLSTKEQRSWLKKITCIESYPVCKNTLLAVVDSDAKKTVILEALKIIGEFGNTNDAKKIYHLTKSQDNSIAAQTIKSVGAINLDTILPELNKFLAHDDPRIKSAAFEVYAVADKGDAVQYVGTMLKNPNDSVRRMGLSLIPQLDYPSAEPLLWWMLSHETNVELQDQVGYMVAANPTRDGIIKMFEFSHDKNGELKEGFKEMWSAALISAENVLGMSQHDIEESCWVAVVSEQKAEQEQEKSDYKFKSVVGEKDDIEAEIDSKSLARPDDNFVEKVLIHVYEHKVQYISGVCILFAIFMFSFFFSGESSAPSSKPLTRKDKHVVVSEANFLPDEELSDRKTQVGTKDWVGGIKSSAATILSSPKYASTIKRASEEREEFQKALEKAEEENFRKVANDSSASQEERDWAAANLNENYKQGLKSYNSGNYRDALISLERAADDPNLNLAARLDAMEKITDIYGQNKDKENWKKWMDKMFKEMVKMPGFETLKEIDSRTGGSMTNFSDNMGKLENLSRTMQDNPQLMNGFVEELTKQGYSQEEANDVKNSIMNFKYPFEDTSSDGFGNF
ncbi:MAG: HEAT repeat domain-containing protein [Candidatus Riflebacteria bacterium]|nr:HEAT repeat domain-containing protein [Candidatus Riflebacteria bacterium]